MTNKQLNLNSLNLDILASSLNITEMKEIIQNKVIKATSRQQLTKFLNKTELINIIQKDDRKKSRVQRSHENKIQTNKLRNRLKGPAKVEETPRSMNSSHYKILQNSYNNGTYNRGG